MELYKNDLYYLEYSYIEYLQVHKEYYNIVCPKYKLKIGKLTNGRKPNLN